MIVNKKKENLSKSGLCRSPDHRVKLKEGEKRDKYLDLARKLKKLWNAKVTVTLIVNGTPVTVTK